MLSPDAVWLTIAQGVANHVRLNAESLRPRLVRHAGRRKLTVETIGPPSSVADWERVIAGFRDQLGEVIGDGRARLLTCSFSTTTPAAAVASEIILMDVYAPYCEYEVACICGIPEVTLSGTPEDWRAIRDRVDVIAELGLGEWGRSLARIADRLVATADGNPDPSFWRDIYKPREAYGWDRVTGWIARLFPYVRGDGRFDRPNPLLRYPVGELPREAREASGSGERWYTGPGLIAEDAPDGTSQVLLHLRDRGGGGEGDVILEGGLLGVAQDTAGRLEPIAGWLVRPPTASMAALLENLGEAGHLLEPARPTSRPLTGSIEIVTLFRNLHAAILFEGPEQWQPRPTDEHEHIEVPLPSGQHLCARRLIDLPDGTCIGAADVERTTVLVRLRIEPIQVDPRSPDLDDDLTAIEPPRGRTTQPAAEVPVLEGTLTEVLARALETGGDTNLLTTGATLLDVAPAWALEPLPTAEERRAAREQRRARGRRRPGTAPPTD